MPCPNCGKENQPGTRFCVHCGTAQAAAAAPANTVTAAMAQAGLPAGARSASVSPAAPAAEPAFPKAEATTPLRPASSSSETVLMPRGSGAAPVTGVTSVDPAQEAADWLPPPVTPARTVAPAADAPPAYQSAPGGRSGMMIVLALAAIGVLGIGGFIYYQLASDRQREAELATNRTSSAAEAPAAAGASRAAAEPVAPSGTASDAGPITKAGTPVADAPRVDAAAPAADATPPSAASAAMPATGVPAASGATPSPAQEPAVRPAPAAPRPPRAPRPAAPKADLANPPAASPAPAPVAPAPKAVPAAAPRPEPPVDRWVQMSSDLARCTREDFINRVVCDQRVRLRYCDGYWGKVSQCPGAPAAEHGQ